MILCRVLGSTVATRKDVKLEGTKLLVVAEAEPDGAERAELHVAADAIGAGAGDLVLVTIGSAARLTSATQGLPLDAAGGRDRRYRGARRRAGLRRRGGRVNLARVEGRVVASRRVEELGSARLVLLQPLDEHEQPAGRALVAADPEIRAGAGATVWFVNGSDAVDALPAREPVDAVVVGLVDRITGAAP